MEMKVSPGDNITLYCDCTVTLGSVVEWIRNCSHENQPSLIIDYMKLYLKIFQRFTFIQNSYNNSYNLHITNISVSDLGLYYCAKLETKVNENEKGFISRSEVYSYGNRTTRLSLKGKKTVSYYNIVCCLCNSGKLYLLSEVTLLKLIFIIDLCLFYSEQVTSCSEPSAPPDCVLCWTLLFSVCPVCVLLSFISVLCLCCKKTTGNHSLIHNCLCCPLFLIIYRSTALQMTILWMSKPCTLN